MKDTTYKEVRVHVASNGYTLHFEVQKGTYSNKTFFVAKTLDEVKKLCEQHLIAPKDI